ncbi:P-loop containing nucleoside triphosphate hydrolase protein [Aaosphaeria arxii CBS 175.79]|uniref:RNA helicase n=1 Tax=Aaosphaeria arxii CBS 175.79 TaxID=1450172 RepID=A0A6A5XRB7_9PLEO|nr:P-loop containing nucleoside triphosphate hydrolase protein [Aaosphaeria arxii CBS 175.79]KAF2015377.1 P-loop containing nucleoside triphosphate hydrolase protein [Aaosphaeria arxii CBS 175.79]
MLRRATRACPFCEVNSLLVRPPVLQPANQQVRLYAQLQRDRSSNKHGSSDQRFSTPRPSFNRSRDKHRPSRMVLSDTVDRPATRPEGKPARKKREPFSYLNKTRVPRDLEQEQERNGQASSRGSFQSRRREDGKRRGKPDAYHALKMQKGLQEIPYGSRSAIKRKIEQVDSFEGLPFLDTLQEAIKDALPGLEYRIPTPAQAVAIPALLGLEAKRRTRNPAQKEALESYLLAAETGSGKTLAYLLPTIDAIKRAEAVEAEEKEREEAELAAAKELDKRDDIFALESPPTTNAVDPARPRAIILVPTAELVAQVGAVAKSLSHTVKFRAAPISAKNTATVIRNRLFNENGVDMIICTPPLLSSIAESNPNILSRVSHLIIDEADSLLDRSFKPFTTGILDRATPSLKKLVLCSATIPRYLDKYLAERYPSMKRLVTPNLHAIPRRVQLGVVDVNKDPYRGNKMLACADTIWQIGKASGDYDPAEGKEISQTKRILVFVNEREETETVAQYLVKKGIDALAFHRDTDPSRQAKTLASFTGTEKPTTTSSSTDDKPNPPAPADKNKRQLANTKVIVTTDLGSRGIDTVSVRHVILYDVPHTTIDFIHRLGRTGRMGRRGRGIVLVGAGDRADVVKEVRDAMFRGEALI